MSLRRLYLLIRYLPEDDYLRRILAAEEEAAKEQALRARLRERRDHYKKLGRSA